MNQKVEKTETSPEPASYTQSLDTDETENGVTSLRHVWHRDFDAMLHFRQTRVSLVLIILI